MTGARLAVMLCLSSVLLGCRGSCRQSIPSPATDSSVLYESTGELSPAHVPHDTSEVLVWEWMPDLHEGDGTGRQKEGGGELRLLELSLERGSRNILWRAPAPFCPTRSNTDVHTDLRVVHVGNDVDSDSGNPRSAAFVWDASTPHKPSVQLSRWVEGLGAKPRWGPQGDAVCYILKGLGDSGPEGTLRLVALPVPRPAIRTDGQVISSKESNVRDFAWSPEGHQLYVSGYSQQKQYIDIVQYPGLAAKQFILPGAAFHLTVAQDTRDVIFAVQPPRENGRDDQSEVTDIWRLSPGSRPRPAISIPRKSLHAMSVSPDGTLIAVIPRAGEGPRETGVGVSVFSLADGTSHGLPDFEGRTAASADWVLGGRGLLILDGSRAWLVDTASVLRRGEGE